MKSSGSTMLSDHLAKHVLQPAKQSGGPPSFLPVSIRERTTTMKDMDMMGSSLVLKNSSTAAVTVCLNLPKPGIREPAVLAPTKNITLYNTQMDMGMIAYNLLPVNTKGTREIMQIDR